MTPAIEPADGPAAPVGVLGAGSFVADESAAAVVMTRRSSASPARLVRPLARPMIPTLEHFAAPRDPPMVEGTAAAVRDGTPPAVPR